MFRQAPRHLKAPLRDVHSQVARLGRGVHTKTHTIRGSQRAIILASSTAAVGGLIWYNSKTTIHGDAPETNPTEAVLKAKQALCTGINEDGSLTAVVWGSNKSNIISPENPGIESVRIPSVANWLQNVALRDLALHDQHAACVDARGDVYQWGNGFYGSAPKSDAEAMGRKPTLTLQGKNIIRLQLTGSRVFALSASGKIYVFAAKAGQQKSPVGAPTPSSTPWWGTGWFWGEEEAAIDFAQLTPKEAFGWKERFVSIAAGRDHLLALTSTGRTYAHPINKNANSHGQLGFRKFDIPIPSSSTVMSPSSRLAVELVPKSIADPFANSTPFSRADTPSAGPTVSDNLQQLDDQNIGFSDTLFEIQALKGINVSQIAAGGRSSYVLTDSGRALGWGANEFGQVGLGSNVTLDTITVPTEIVLSRNVPGSLRTSCLDIAAGGDLACFVAERSGGNTAAFVDLLMCGNGQWGGLGNNVFSNAQGNPLRVKNVSGLREFDEKEQALTPIFPHAISISPTGHVLMTLDTRSQAGSGATGRDLLVWGTNRDYQLGTGKRTSLAVPTNLEQADSTRFMLANAKAPVRDLSGKLWKKGVEVEQCAVAGYGNSIVYWKIR
ncbi:hypothetical protein SERLA73DRAFT_186528 [Serpula lacrymans var. lacrymans S7.3]|uniref:RCC1/BLIP-II protein n=2 Tax=Serpula lacrymans var. lacrymans TaxID=341189 RepID=F8Q7F7_SERL3|nr:uncharacterized protein SERLADRAFT_475639 [Serpula lacrymans var. lacrymans S7.9]EGN95495.1 hypothetical protein SERLA73DRAFT_186528 [Serpula lacrymans var. lacrymans S7.3]EGO21023.1 hypothetical protein SERLADRAFT_475639 [Serpula lacrymans var. lacrymans S7.9]